MRCAPTAHGSPPSSRTRRDDGRRLVLHKPQRLRSQIALTRARHPSAPEALSTDLVLRDALALSLMVALQEAIDIAYHVVADEGWGVPDSHRAAFESLAAHGVLSLEHAGQLCAATAMRNRIAHGYASIDHDRLWRELPDGLQPWSASRLRSRPGFPSPRRPN